MSWTINHETNQTYQHPFTDSLQIFKQKKGHDRILSS